MESVQIITGPIRGVQRRGGSQQAWGCGWGDRFGGFGLLFFLVTYLAPFPTPSQHVRAQKIPGVELVVCDSALIGL